MAITLERAGSRIYILGDTYPVKDRIKAALNMDGKNFDRERKAWWVGLAKAADAEKLVAELNAAPPVPPGERLPDDPDKIRLTGKGRYKGREYFAGAITRDGSKVRLLTLPDAQGKFLDFWAPCDMVEQTKTYTPREYRGRTEYTTLGSIAAFIERQKNPDTARGRCTECDHYGPAGQTCEECHEGTHVA